MKLIEMKQVSKAYKDVVAVDNITFSIEEGEIVSIIGPSGSGKSTMLRLIAGLEKADTGTIWLFDKMICQSGIYSNKDISVYHQIGMIFQEFHLFDHLTVEKNIALALKTVLKKSKIEVNHIVDEMLALVKLEDKKKGYPGQLSGGQKQRIAIARSLALAPQLLLLDEPTSALDVETIEDLISLMQLLKEKKMTVLIVTHEINFAKNVSTRIVFMENAVLKMVSKTDEDKRIRKFLQIN